MLAIQTTGVCCLLYYVVDQLRHGIGDDLLSNNIQYEDKSDAKSLAERRHPYASSELEDPPWADVCNDYHHPSDAIVAIIHSKCPIHMLCTPCGRQKYHR